MSIEPRNEYIPTADEVETFGRQLALANRAALKALEAAGIPESEDMDSAPISTRWRAHFGVNDDTIVLSIEFRSLTTSSLLHIGLTHIVHEILRDLERLLSDPGAREFFEIGEKEDLEQAVFDRLVSISINYIGHLPLVIYQGFCQATEEAIISDIKKVVEPMFRLEELQNGGRSLNLLPNKRLNDISKRFPQIDFELLRFLDLTSREFRVYRNAALSSRKAWLTPTVFETLSDTYDELRVKYKTIKKKHTELQNAYTLIHKNVVGWANHWQEHLAAEFSGCIFSELDNERTPSELAYRHLAIQFDYHEKSIERKVRDSRSLNREKKTRTIQELRPKAKHPSRKIGM